MVALLLIPIAGLMGAGVDFTRTYLVQARMQQACDAGALAGRRGMVGNTISAANRTEAFRYFGFNFPSGLMGTAALVQDDVNAANRVTIALTQDGQLGMHATTVVPTTFLGVVGMADMRVTVDCVSEKFFVNTDIMLVLDTTGSMNCTINDPGTCSQDTEKTNSKMSNMRTALKKLYVDLESAQAALQAKNLRMRYGFVPYSLTVNVGKLIYAENAGYIRSSYQYRDNDNNGTLKPAYNFTSTWINNSWGGCIEERGTSRTVPSATAYDLDIAYIPTNDNTRWAPYFPATSFGNGAVGEEAWNRNSPPSYYVACPKPAVHLRAWTKAQFDAQVDTLVTGDGATYHDIGMIWGTRMLANTGIFASRNPDLYNQVKVSRTIILMTDGVMQPFVDAYSAYGVHRFALRTNNSTNDGNLATTHATRFNLMCSKAKELGADIWVVAIVSSMTNSLRDCATNSSQAMLVGNTTELTNAFKRISDKVGNLRIGG